MGDPSDFGPVRRFRQADYAMPLRIPEGTRFVDPQNKDDLRPALESGLAVFVQSCDGRAFVWPEGGRFLADHFFLGPAWHLEFRTAPEAAAFAAGLCD